MSYLFFLIVNFDSSTEYNAEKAYFTIFITLQSRKLEF